MPDRDRDGRPVLDKDGRPKTHQEEVSRTRVRVNQITSLQNDLALALAAPAIRLEAPVPGMARVGIEWDSLGPLQLAYLESLLRARHAIAS